MNAKLYETLMELGIHPDCCDREDISAKITKHMDEGLNGSQRSIMMLPTYMYAEGEIKRDEDVAVIDAGGTNLRAALVRFTGEGPAVPEIRKSGMPGRTGVIKTDDMYDEFVRRILPLMPESGRLALCFSYPFESLPGGEGRIIAMSKEIEVEDAAGSLIAEGMKRAFRRAGYEKDPKITVLNDTPAVLYSALAEGRREAAGFILGTGMNAAYFENTSRIGKIDPVPHRNMAINMEAAFFSGCPRGKADEIVDLQSKDAGQALFQKLFAGAYLGKLASVCVPFLAEKGLVSAETAANVPEEFAIKDMSQFIDTRSGPVADMCSGDEDAEILADTFRALEERAGLLSASLVAAVVRRMIENGAQTPVPVAVNGSTLLLNRCILERFRSEMSDALGGDSGFELVRNDSDTLIGSAAATFLG